MRIRSAVGSLLLLVTSFTVSLFTCEALSITAKHVLYDMPVSNNGARCRIIVYKKALEEPEVTIVRPGDVGGLKSETYLNMNPQGKMPTMHCTETDFSIPESDTICRHLLSTYANKGPSFLPDDPKSNLLCRFHDMYLTTIQGCLYKDRPPFGIYATRADALAEFNKQLLVIENLVSGGAPYLCGSEISLADATIFPTMVFAKHMLPKFGFDSALPPKIDAWFEQVQRIDFVFKKVYDEVRTDCGALFPPSCIMIPLTNHRRSMAGLTHGSSGIDGTPFGWLVFATKHRLRCLTSSYREKSQQQLSRKMTRFSPLKISTQLLPLMCS